MSTALPYRLTPTDSAFASKIYIDYNVTPGFSRGYLIGDAVTVSGRIINTSGLKLTSVVLYLINVPIPDNGYRFHDVNDAVRRLGILAENVTHDAGKTYSSFSYRFTMPEINRGQSALKFAAVIDFNKASGEHVRLYAYNWSDRDDCIAYLTQRLIAENIEMEVERCASNGAAKNDGTMLRCKRFCFTLDGDFSAGDITVAKVRIRDSTGEIGEASISESCLASAMTAGYSESGYGATSLFYGHTFQATQSYELIVSLGDRYDQVSDTFVVPIAFARIHLSGAKNGGFAVGMFSTATDTQPLFEVAESHKARLYGGIDGVNNYQLGEVATGGHWIDGKPIYRRVISFSGKQTGNNLAMDASFTPDVIGALIHVDMILRGSANGAYYPVPFVFSTTSNTSEGYRLGWSLRDATGLSLHIGASYSAGYTVTAVIDYTKAAAADPSAPDGPEIIDLPANQTDTQPSEGSVRA